jgi:sigma-B regulation protein RsbU (phosphoserine phosphatase)
MDTEPGSLLVVDDDDTNRAMLRRYLEPRGLSITDARDGAEALTRLAEGSFDLVLLDILMPGPSGLEVLRDLRRRHSMTALPVIMATVRDDTADVVEALRLGANDYLTKPFNFPVVLARVQTQLALKRSVDRIRALEKEMRDELERAAKVQKALLPETLPRVPGVHLSWKFEPCAELAGDLLNVVRVDDRRVALYVFDVEHHGVKAALLAVMVTRVLAQLLRYAGRRPDDATGPSPLRPAEVADYLERLFPWDQRTRAVLHDPVRHPGRGQRRVPLRLGRPPGPALPAPWGRGPRPEGARLAHWVAGRDESGTLLRRTR